jgi:hypothetical protein
VPLPWRGLSGSIVWCSIATSRFALRCKGGDSFSRKEEYKIIFLIIKPPNLNKSN